METSKVIIQNGRFYFEVLPNTREYIDALYELRVKIIAVGV